MENAVEPGAERRELSSRTGSRVPVLACSDHSHETVQVFMTGLAVWLMDKAGRRLLLMVRAHHALWKQDSDTQAKQDRDKRTVFPRD